MKIKTCRVKSIYIRNERREKKESSIKHGELLADLHFQAKLSLIKILHKMTFELNVQKAVFCTQTLRNRRKIKHVNC